MEDVQLGKLFYPSPIIHFIPQLKKYIFNPDVIVPIYKIVTKKG